MIKIRQKIDRKYRKNDKKRQKYKKINKTQIENQVFLVVGGGKRVSKGRRAIKSDF